MAYGDLSIFLPRAEGDKLNTEQARAQGDQQANYLSSMDQFYEGLEENQRQFDITSALSERQFEWMSGFEEEKLAEETRLGEKRLSQDLMRIEIEGKTQETQAEYYRRQLELEGTRVGFEGERVDLAREQLAATNRQAERSFDLQTNEQNFLQWLYTDQNTMAQDKFDLEKQVIEKELGGSDFRSRAPYGMAGHSAFTDRTGGASAWWRQGGRSRSTPPTRSRTLKFNSFRL